MKTWPRPPTRSSAASRFCAGAPSTPRRVQMANALSGHPGMTARLTVRYRKPTPLDARLHLHARTERVDGRRITTVASLRAGDTVTAEAEGLFVVIGTERVLEYFGERPSTPEPTDPLP